MKVRLATLGVVASLVAGVSLMAATAAPAAPTPVTAPATCTAVGTTDPVSCTLSLVGFNTQGGTLNAVLQLTNNVTGAVTQIVQPLVNTSSTCTILDLTIQPIDLDLLGLHLHTDTIHVVLTAQRGTLLGNLLCGLFFGPSPPLGVVSTLLNSLLAQGAISTV